MQPFARAIPDFEVGRKAFHVFDDFFIYEGNAEFQTVGHGKFVGIHQEFIGESGSDFQELEATQFIRVSH